MKAITVATNKQVQTIKAKAFQQSSTNWTFAVQPLGIAVAQIHLCSGFWMPEQQEFSHSSLHVPVFFSGET